MAFDTPFGSAKTHWQEAFELWQVHGKPVYDILPFWIWVLFGVVLVAWIFHIRNQIVMASRSRRWRVQKRRLAGIPDDDYRPFEIAKMAAEERRVRKMKLDLIDFEKRFAAAAPTGTMATMPATKSLECKEATIRRRKDDDAQTQLNIDSDVSTENGLCVVNDANDEIENQVLNIKCSPQQVWDYFFEYGLLDDSEWPDIHSEEKVKDAFQLAMKRLVDRGGSIQIDGVATT